MLESNKIFEWVYINKTDNVFGRNAGGQPEIVRFMVDLAFVCRFCPLPAESVQQIDEIIVYARKLFRTAHATDSSENQNVCELLTQACPEESNHLPNTEVHFAVHHSTFYQWNTSESTTHTVLWMNEKRLSPWSIRPSLRCTSTQIATQKQQEVTVYRHRK